MFKVQEKLSLISHPQCSLELHNLPTPCRVFLDSASQSTVIKNDIFSILLLLASTKNKLCS